MIKLVVTFLVYGMISSCSAISPLPDMENNLNQVEVQETLTENAVGTTIAQEAESGAVYKPMFVKSDVSASEQIYVSSFNDYLYSVSNPPADGNLVYSFNITDPGTYYFWIRAMTPNYSIDSYWIRFDSASWKVWSNIGPASTWSWMKYGGSAYFSAGRHTVRLAYREITVKLDKVLITKDPNYRPSGLGNAVPVPPKTAYKSNTVTKNGNLKLVNNQLCNSAGSPVQLRGFSTHGIQWYKYFPGTTIPNMVKNWNIDLIRVAMYVEDYYNWNDFWNGYKAHPSEMKAWMKNYVNDAINSGVYVIIDWHIHNDPSQFTDLALQFFKEMSITYGKYPNVIFEICNEPLGWVSWSTIKSYSQQIIKTIRDNDSDSNPNLIIVGTPNWSQHPDIAANDPITGYANIMYSLHFYAASHKQEIRDRAVDALTGSNKAGNNYNRRKIPLFVTEWGTSDYGVSVNDFTESQTWVNFMNSYKLSWVNWSFCNKDETSSILLPTANMAGPWQSADLSASGKWVIGKLPPRP